MSMEHQVNKITINLRSEYNGLGTVQFTNVRLVYTAKLVLKNACAHVTVTF